MIAGDVGQDHIEEIDIVNIGENYGWNLKEGTFRFDPQTGNVSDNLNELPEDLIDPVAQYDHDDGLSIIGGYVYRGTAIPELAGKYIFGDFSRSFSPADGRLFYADLETGSIHEFTIGIEDIPLDLYVKGFGQDLQGVVYVLASSNLGPYGTGGVVLKIVDTEPGFRGDTVSGATKPAKLETGKVVKVPLFVEPGQLIKVDTRTGEYIERA